MVRYLTYLISIAGYMILLGLVITVLRRKREPVSALAWIIAIVFIPYLGALAFLLFGNNHIERPLAKKKKHRSDFRALCPLPGSVNLNSPSQKWEEWAALSKLMTRICDHPLVGGNVVRIFYDGHEAYKQMFLAIDSATKQICLQTYILQNDEVGRKFIDLLSAKAKKGVEVNLLYDAIGSRKLPSSILRRLTDAGGRVATFLPVNILHRHFQINLRNHRKILVVDGRIAFTGGLNIGQEYIGQNPKFGYWRDTHLSIIGPAVKDLLYVFSEDWHFATSEHLDTDYSFPPAKQDGHDVQIIGGGPDQQLNGIREFYYSITSRAKERLWISTPYFIPDESMIDGLRMAALMDVDVRLLTQDHPPDQWLPYLAARYYWEDMLKAGVRIWQYERGMFHAKVLIVDHILASVGSANFDIRSLKLDFEVNTILYSKPLIRELEDQFLRDLSDSREVDMEKFLERSNWAQAAENACRLFSPLL